MQEARVSDFVTSFAIVVAAIGWFISYLLNRRLQRRQLAIQLINKHRFSHLWTHSSRVIMDIVRSNINYDWKSVVENHKANVASAPALVNSPAGPKTDPDNELYYCLFRVLNYFEFLSNAMLGRIAAEYIIKRQLKTNFLTLYRSTEPLIRWLRSQPYASESQFEHFEKICRKWKDESRPTWLTHLWNWMRDQ